MEQFIETFKQKRSMLWYRENMKEKNTLSLFRGQNWGKKVIWSSCWSLYGYKVTHNIAASWGLFSCPSVMLAFFPPQDLSQCKNVMIERGELFLKKISLSRGKVGKLCHTFIKDGAVSAAVPDRQRSMFLCRCSGNTLISAFRLQKILTHSSSRVVLKVLENAAADNKRFTVYVTESQPDSAGWVFIAWLSTLLPYKDSMQNTGIQAKGFNVRLNFDICPFFHRTLPE